MTLRLEQRSEDRQDQWLIARPKRSAILYKKQQQAVRWRRFGDGRGPRPAFGRFYEHTFQQSCHSGSRLRLHVARRSRRAFRLADAILGATAMEFISNFWAAYVPVAIVLVAAIVEWVADARHGPRPGRSPDENARGEAVIFYMSWPRSSSARPHTSVPAGAMPGQVISLQEARRRRSRPLGKNGTPSSFAGRENRGRRFDRSRGELMPPA